MPKRKSCRGGQGGGVVKKQAKKDMSKVSGSEENKTESSCSGQIITHDQESGKKFFHNTVIYEDAAEQDNTKSYEAEELTEELPAKTKAVLENSDVGDASGPENAADEAQKIIEQLDEITDVIITDEQKNDDVGKQKVTEQTKGITDIPFAKKEKNDDQEKHKEDTDEKYSDVIRTEEIVPSEDALENKRNISPNVNKEDMSTKENPNITKCDEIEADTTEEKISDNSSLEQAKSFKGNKSIREGTLELVNDQKDKHISSNKTNFIEGDVLETISVHDDFEDNHVEAAKSTCIEDDSLEAISGQDDFEDELMEAENTVGIDEDALETVSVQDNLEDEAGNTVGIDEDALEAVSVQDNLEDEAGNTVSIGEDAFEAVSVQDNLEDKAGNAISIEEDALEAVSVHDNLDDELMEAEVAKGDGSDREEVQYVDEEADEEQNLLDIISSDQNKSSVEEKMDDKMKQNLINSKFEEISEGSINQADQEEVLNESFSDVEIIGESFGSQQKKIFTKSVKQRLRDKEAESLEEVFFATENDHSKVTAEDKDNDDISDGSLSDHEKANMSLEEISDDDVDVSKKRKSLGSSYNDNDEKPKKVEESRVADDSKPEVRSTPDKAGDEISEEKQSNNESKKSSQGTETNAAVNSSDKEKPLQKSTTVLSTKAGRKRVDQKEETAGHLSKPHSQKVSKASLKTLTTGSANKNVMTDSTSQTAPHQMKGKIIQCTINPIQPVHKPAMVETDFFAKGKLSSKFLDEFCEKLPFSIPKYVIGKIASHQTCHESCYSLNLGPITFADIGSTEFRDNLLKKSDEFNISFDEHHHGIYRALIKNQESVAALVRQLKWLQLGNRFLTISLSYGQDKKSSGVINLMYDQDIQSRKQQSGKGDAKLRARIKLTNVPDGVSKDFVHLLFPEALSIVSGPRFDNKRSLFLGFSRTTQAEEMLLCHDLVVVNGHQVSLAASEYVERSTSEDSRCSVQDGSVVIHVASESSEEAQELVQPGTEPMTLGDSASSTSSPNEPCNNEAYRGESTGSDHKESSMEVAEAAAKDNDVLAESESHTKDENKSSTIEKDTEPDTQQPLLSSDSKPVERAGSISEATSKLDLPSEEPEVGFEESSSNLDKDRNHTEQCEIDTAKKAETVAVGDEEKSTEDRVVDHVDNMFTSENRESSVASKPERLYSLSKEKACDDNITSGSTNKAKASDESTASASCETENTSTPASCTIGAAGDNVSTVLEDANATAEKATLISNEAKEKVDISLVSSEEDATCENTYVTSASIEAKNKTTDDNIVSNTMTSDLEKGERMGRDDKCSEQKESLDQNEPVANKSLEDVSDEEMIHHDKQEVSVADDIVILKETSFETVIDKIDLTLEESTASDAEERSSKLGTADGSQGNATEKKAGKNSTLWESDERLHMTDAGFEIDMEVIDVGTDKKTDEKVLYPKQVSEHSKQTARFPRKQSQGASQGRVSNRDSERSLEPSKVSPRRDSNSREKESYYRSDAYRLVPSREETAQRRDIYHQYGRRRSRSPTSYRDENWNRDAQPPARHNFYPSVPGQYPVYRPPYTYRPTYPPPEQQWKPSYETHSYPSYPDSSRPTSYPRMPGAGPDRQSGYQYSQQHIQYRMDGNRKGRPEASPPWQGTEHSRGRKFQMPSSSHLEKQRASPPPSKYRSRSRSLSDMSDDSYGEPPSKKANKRIKGREVSSSAKDKRISRSPISISSRSQSLSPVSGSPSPNRNLLRNEIVKSVKQFLHVAREIQQVKGTKKSSHSGSPPIRHVSTSRRSPTHNESSIPRRRVVHKPSRRSPSPAQVRRQTRSPPPPPSHRLRSPAHQKSGKHPRSPKREYKSSYRHRSPSPVSSESSPGSPQPPSRGRYKEYQREPSSYYKTISSSASSSRHNYGPRSKRSREPKLDVTNSHISGGERIRSMDKKVMSSTWSDQQREKIAAGGVQFNQPLEAPPPSVMPTPAYIHPSGPMYPYSSPYPPAASGGHQGYNAYSSGVYQPSSNAGPYQQQYGSTGYQQPFVPPAAYTGTHNPTESSAHVAEAYKQAFSFLKTALGELQQPQQQQHPYPTHAHPPGMSRPHTSSQSMPSASSQTKSLSMGSNTMVFQRVLGQEGLSRKNSGTIEPLSDRGRHERPKVAKDVRVLTSVPTKKR
ncbi:hypothetical protein ElyMa_002262200 [Elysia marginata]|uniref:RRM domain-containing protein n=1 Tax=Elysia marginata TaxID=1093978 RepID=A0AAV4FZA3_9GAST|nr:hypothetical protein ElyMa_002262200 [Elysia marginata]